MSKVLFSDLEKGQVLAALYNGAKPSKKYITEYDPKTMFEIEGKKMTLRTNNFSYIKGRLLLIIFVKTPSTQNPIIKAMVMAPLIKL